MMESKRRTFLLGGALATVSVSSGTYLWLRKLGYEVDPPQALSHEPRPKQGPLTFPPFDPQARATLTSFFDHLLPGHEELRLPSAEQTKIMAYIDRAVRAPGLSSVRNEFIRIARTLDILSRKEGGTSFDQTPDASQADIVERLRSGEGASGRFQPQRALKMALALALEGYLGHEAHGGNPSHITWQALQIPMATARSPLGHKH